MMLWTELYFRRPDWNDHTHILNRMTVIPMIPDNIVKQMSIGKQNDETKDNVLVISPLRGQKKKKVNQMRRMRKNYK
jgi:hypothetical protein